jgi:hypothetical protein
MTATIPRRIELEGMIATNVRQDTLCDECSRHLEQLLVVLSLPSLHASSRKKKDTVPYA